MAKKVRLTTKKEASNRISLNDATIAQAVREIQKMAPISVSATAIIRSAVMDKLAALKAQATK